MQKFSFMVRVIGQKTISNKINLVVEEGKFDISKGQIIKCIRVTQYERMRNPKTVLITVSPKGKREIILMC